ncbi:glycosyltransferase family 2 protein, partial [Streptomyces sp. NPDC054950]
MTRPTVSVVIPTRDKADSLRLVLACLARQSCPEPHEIVVVDDGCTDGTADVVTAAAAQLPLHTVPGPRAGRAAARNAGAAAARGGLLIFLDDDILLPPQALAAHLAGHTGREPGCVGGPVRELTPPPRRVGAARAEHQPHPPPPATAGRGGRPVAAG